MDNRKAKKALTLAAAIYIASFLILNWGDVSWVFNYKAVYGLISDFFNPYPSIDALSMKGYFYPNHSKDGAPGLLNSVKTVYTEKHNILEIPSLSLEVPIVFSSSQDIDKITKDLDSGVVFYPGSVYPGQQGQIVILGHSAPLGWPKTQYDWVFSQIEDLEYGDKIYIDINKKQYSYTIKSKTIIKKGADIPAFNTLSNTLTLISCWPPGKDYQRIAVSAEIDL